MKPRMVVLNVSFSEEGVAIDYGNTGDIRDNASTGSPVIMSHHLELAKNNKQYRDEIEEIEDRVRDLIVDVLEDFEVAEPMDVDKSED